MPPPQKPTPVAEETKPESEKEPSEEEEKKSKNFTTRDTLYSELAQISVSVELCATC